MPANCESKKSLNSGRGTSARLPFRVGGLLGRLGGGPPTAAHIGVYLLCMVGLAAVALVLTLRLNAQIDAVRVQASEASSDLGRVSTQAAVAAQVPSGNTPVSIRATATTQALIANLQRDSSGSSVVLTTLHAQASATQPGKESADALGLGLHGTYPNVKRVLAATADRYANVMFDRISFRRGASPADIDVALFVTMDRPPVASARPVTR